MNQFGAGELARLIRLDLHQQARAWCEFFNTQTTKYICDVSFSADFDVLHVSNLPDIDQLVVSPGCRIKTSMTDYH
jgi:hypothetical protein